MSRTVWKYELQPGINAIQVAPGSRIVAVDRLDWNALGPAVWIERDREDLLVAGDPGFRLMVVGTGSDVPEGASHVGSAWCGPFMWHVYELPPS